jgi:hypothetical protein
MKALYTPLLALALFTPAVRAGTLTLNFHSLPSAQGWTYVSNGPAETNTFSTDGTRLRQDTIGTGFTYADYARSNAIDPNLPFTISFRARVLRSEQAQAGAPASALIVYGGTGNELFGIGLGTNVIEAPFGSPTFHPIDATLFHDYRIDAVPGESVSIFVDEVLLVSHAPIRYVTENGLRLGNGSSFENGVVEITRYVFTQRLGPTVSATVSCVDVCWDSLTNRQYQVQYRSDLTTNQWRDLGSLLPGSGSTNCITDTVRGEPRRFYRVVETRP